MISARVLAWLCILLTMAAGGQCRMENVCPPEQEILPCQCKIRGPGNVLITCRRSSTEELSLILAVLSRRVSVVEELMLEDNDIPELPARMLASLAVRRLLLWNNDMERIADDAFDGSSEYLEDLHIREPRLSQFPVDGLRFLISLKHLIVEHTPLEQLPRLSRCRALSRLHVDSTNIRRLESGALHQMEALQTVQITRSQLERLESDSLAQLSRLQSLNLSSNLLSELPASAIRYLPVLKVFDVRANRLSNITDVVDVLTSFPFVQTVNLNDNRIRVIPTGGVHSLQSLTSLSLSANGIASIGHDALADLPSLLSLDLSFNRLTSFPMAVFLRTSSLRRLILTGNPLDDVRALDPILSQQSRLEQLELDRCQITNISYHAFQSAHPSLTRLNLRGNRLRTIAAGAFERLPALTTLDLAENQINNGAVVPRVRMASKWSFLNELPSLTNLDLSANPLTRIDPNFLAPLPSLRFLNLSNTGLNTVDPGSWVAVNRLQRLDLSNNLLSNFDPSVCALLPQLEDLDLSFNRIVRVRREAPAACHKLRRLDLSHNELQSLRPDTFEAYHQLQVLDMSFNSLRNVPFLGHSIHLRNVRLNHNEIDRLAEADFGRNRALECVDLSHNRIDRLPDDFLQSSADQLHEIDLSFNKIRAFPVDVVKSWTQLIKLDLSFNQIEDLQGRKFHVFEPPASLRYLNLSHNNISFVDTDGIERNEIQILDLSHNAIQDLSAFSLRKMASVSELDLSHNAIQTLDPQSFVRSKALIRLDLSDNRIESVAANSFRQLPNLRWLTMDRNRVSRVERDAFYDLTSLESLSLAENRIEAIHADAFHGPAGLRSLNLSDNQLATLPSAGLEHLLSLECLDLSRNQIRLLDSRTFRRLNRLAHLNLDHNALCRIEDGALQQQRKLRKLSLRHNQVTTLRETFLSRSSDVPKDLELDVADNPLRCDCDVQWLSRWHSAAKSSSDVLCQFPTEVRGVALRSLLPSQLACTERSARDDGCAAQPADPAPVSNKTSDDHVTGDTPTLYAGLRQPIQAASAPEATNPPSLLDKAIPTLKLGLNLLPAIIGVGSLMAELVRAPNPIEIDERMHLERPVSEENLPFDKPIRGPDDESWLVDHPARIPVTGIDSRPWIWHPELEEEDERQFIPLHRPNPIYSADDPEGWNPMTSPSPDHQMAVTSSNDLPSDPVLESPEATQDPPTTSAADLAAVEQPNGSSFQKLLAFLQKFNDSVDVEVVATEETVPKPILTEVAATTYHPDALRRTQNGSVTSTTEAGTTRRKPESLNVPNAYNRSVSETGTKIRRPESANLQLLLSTRKPPLNKTRYTLKTTRIPATSSTTTGTTTPEMRTTTPEPTPASDPPESLAETISLPPNTTAGFDNATRADLIIRPDESSNSTTPEAADWQLNATSPSNQSVPVATTANPADVLQRSKDVASTSSTTTEPPGTEPVMNDQPFVPGTELPILTLEPWELDVRSGKVDLPAGPWNEPVPSSASLVRYSLSSLLVLAATLLA